MRTLIRWPRNRHPAAHRLPPRIDHNRDEAANVRGGASMAEAPERHIRCGSRQAINLWSDHDSPAPALVHGLLPPRPHASPARASNDCSRDRRAQRGTPGSRGDNVACRPSAAVAGGHQNPRAPPADHRRPEPVLKTRRPGSRVAPTRAALSQGHRIRQREPGGQTDPAARSCRRLPRA